MDRTLNNLVEKSNATLKKINNEISHFRIGPARPVTGVFRFISPPTKFVSRDKTRQAYC